MKVYVIHVKSAVDREKHINNQLFKQNMVAEFITDGDKDELTDTIISTYFSNEMLKVSNATSCAYKHILSYEKMIENNIPYALILEDDIVLLKKFSFFAEKVMNEVAEKDLDNFIISLEDSSLKFVKGSERKKGKYIYSKPYGRMAGAYIIDATAAKNILSYISKVKCFLPIDWFHNECADKKLINIYWSHPAIATQLSINGTFTSLIDNKKTGILRIFVCKIQKVYKKILYRLR